MVNRASRLAGKVSRRASRPRRMLYTRLINSSRREESRTTLSGTFGQRGDLVQHMSHFAMGTLPKYGFTISQDLTIG